MRMYVSGIEDENPDWYDLVTNDGDEERVREVAEAAAEAVAAAGMDAKAQLARLDGRGGGGQKDTPPPGATAQIARQIASAIRRTRDPHPIRQQVVAAGQRKRGPAAGPRGGEDPVPGGR